VTDSEHDVTVGDAGDFELDLENVGDEDLTDATVSVNSLDGDLSFGSDGQGSQTFVGDWDAGNGVELVFRAEADGAAIQRAYPVEIEIEYDDEDGDEGTRTLLTSLTPEEEQTFEAGLVDHTVAIGDDGLMEFNITNHGPENATAASISVSAPDGAIDIGSGAEDADLGGGEIQGVELGGFDGGGGDGGAGVGESEAFVGELPAGESTTLRFLGSASSDAIEREYTLEVTVEYEDGDGDERTERTLNSASSRSPSRRSRWMTSRARYTSARTAISKGSWSTRETDRSTASFSRSTQNPIRSPRGRHSTRSAASTLVRPRRSRSGSVPPGKRSPAPERWSSAFDIGTSTRTFGRATR